MRIKNEKAITLIALVITIIILLILSGIAISMIAGDNGILTHAKRAKEETEKAALNEQEDLEDIEALINDETSTKKWSYKEDERGRETIITDGEIELHIGDIVEYNPTKGAKTKTYKSPTGTYVAETYSSALSETEQGSGWSKEQEFNVDDYKGKWKVLGTENGEILLISTDSVGDYWLRGQTGLTYGVKELDNICSIYGEGKCATGARSIRVEDVNRITGYNPNNEGVYDPKQTGDGAKAYESSGVRAYGNTVKFTWGETEGYFKYEYTGTNTGSDIITQSYAAQYAERGFNYCDENWNWHNKKYVNGEEICTLKKNSYTYFPNSLTFPSNSTVVGISQDSPEYKTLFCDSNGEKFEFWLASRSINMYNNLNIDYNMYYFYSLAGGIYSDVLYRASGNNLSNTNGVRPVVSLKSSVIVTGNSADGWKIK